MAIYHLHARVIQRSKGQSVVAASAYRKATRLQDRRLQKIWNYSDKQNVIHTEMMAPADAPAWMSELVKLHEIDPSQASEQLWNLVESSEKRVDAQLARKLEFALPIELNAEQNIFGAIVYLESVRGVRNGSRLGCR